MFLDGSSRSTRNKSFRSAADLLDLGAEPIRPVAPRGVADLLRADGNREGSDLYLSTVDLGAMRPDIDVHVVELSNGEQEVLAPLAPLEADDVRAEHAAEDRAPHVVGKGAGGTVRPANGVCEKCRIRASGASSRSMRGTRVR